MVGTNFNSLYRILNPQQKKAVDAIEGPVMVIAGPGTGKTQILTLRIANILKKTDTGPDSILALTFTESGVFSMRKRLVEMIGSAGYRVNIYTFHSFCNEIIKEFPDAFPKIIGATNINDIDKIGILKEIILSLELKTLKPFGDNFYYIHPLKGYISSLKRENISPIDLEVIIKKQKAEYKAIEDLKYTSGAHKGKIKGKYRNIEKQIRKNEELLIIYEKYEEALLNKRYYDYDDMIVETIKALESDSDLLLQLQEEYQYVLADEHQDANNAQNKLLEHLTSFHDNPNLFIVGDEKQAIFKFQGASLDNFLYFKKRYKNALLITLTDNYRSTQAILDGAHSLISNSDVSDKKLRERLKSHATGKSSKIEVRSFSNTDFEMLFLASDIQKKLDEGVSPEEITVIYRNNKDAEPVSHVLEKTKIPFSIESDQNILKDTDIQKFITLLRAVNKFGEDSSLLPLLHASFLKIDSLDIYKILRFAQKKKIPIYEVISKKKNLIASKVQDTGVLNSLYLDLKIWKKVSENKGVLDTVELVATESGFLEYLLQHNESVEKLEKLSGLFRDITQLIENHKGYGFPDLIDYFNDIDEHNILIKKDSKTKGVKAVRLMTAHKSKGLEFDYVYIIGAYDKHFGNQRTINHFDISTGKSSGDKIDEERRLFYVALTRAKIHAMVSYSREGVTGRQQLPTQFIEEIDEDLVADLDTEEFEKTADTNLLLSPGRKIVVPPIGDKEFLNGIFLDQGLSVTALNNYLSCPWNYFYSNLLRVPKVPTKHLLFGTIVHHVLKDYFNKLKAGENVNDKTLLKLFNEYVNQASFTESELKEAVEKGNTAFPGYFRKYKSSWNTNTLNEFRISVLLPVEIEGETHLRLRGDLDKMEIEGGGRKVNVVDYKTGKPKSRNHIEGKTKTSNGDYKRQLVFYKLLLSLYDDGKYEMTGGDIDFIEPDEKGEYHKESFEVTEEEVEDLKEVIVNTTNEILNLSFWNERCENKDCKYCELRDKMDI
jgi:DNA helicase-2/ATP-dependent DNA helicase PcrA